MRAGHILDETSFNILFQTVNLLIAGQAGDRRSMAAIKKTAIKIFHCIFFIAHMENGPDPILSLKTAESKFDNILNI